MRVEMGERIVIEIAGLAGIPRRELFVGKRRK
jgi:hypothetical protein